MFRLLGKVEYAEGIYACRFQNTENNQEQIDRFLTAQDIKKVDNYTGYPVVSLEQIEAMEQTTRATEFGQWFWSN